MESLALSDSHQIKLNAQSGIITSNAIPVPLVTAWPKPRLCLNTNFPACSTLRRILMSAPLIATAREAFYAFLVQSKAFVFCAGAPSVADASSAQSHAIATAMFSLLGISATGPRLPGQRAGKIFEEACTQFLEDTFLKLSNIRPGDWEITRGVPITNFYQYEHLETLAQLADANVELASAMVSDYLVKPDVVISRKPLPEESLAFAIDNNVGVLSPLRATNGKKPLLHASVSCKWTIRSDRSQNTRSEALSLIRNRKGPLPHIVAITAEPTPDRIASIALGTGDMDCVYHAALPELELAVHNVGSTKAKKTLTTLVSGKLLRDISDLPLDLCI